MKALEKDRNRRYCTVSALVADVQRHLSDESVEARPTRTGTLARTNSSLFVGRARLCKLN
jgi:hypothetical protein